jgi:hypothetical protein
VFFPIVYGTVQFLAIEKPDFRHGGNESASIAGPIHRELDILVSHPGKVAIAPVGCGPQEEINATERASRAQTTQKFFRLRVLR